MTQQRYARHRFYRAPQRFTLYMTMTMSHIVVLDSYAYITTSGLATIAALNDGICGLGGGFGVLFYDRQLRYANYAAMVGNGNPVHATYFWLTEDWPSLRF